MKFGVNLMNFGPGAWPDSLTRWAMLTEMLGYHFLMTSDHLAGDAYDIERARGPLPESAILALVGAYDAILCGDDAFTRPVLQKCLPRLAVVEGWGRLRSACRPR